MHWAESFVARLADIRLANTFNPYHDICSQFDIADAPYLRRVSLETVLRAHERIGVDAIWFGRDPGYRGARRTGLALTDEGRLADLQRALPGADVRKVTKGAAQLERTATVVWRVISRLDRPPVLWNAFPLHPYADTQMTNRSHKLSERRTTMWAIRELVERFDPKLLVAIGNDASAALSDLGFTHKTVRHPSYGGMSDFTSGMERLHTLRRSPNETPDLFPVPTLR